MGKPAITNEELLLTLAGMQKPRHGWAVYRRAIIEHRHDAQLLRTLTESLLGTERRPQRLSELGSCNLTSTIDATWRWTVVDKGENPYYISDEVKNLLSWVVPVLHLKYVRADNNGTDDIQVLLSRRGGGRWIVLLKLYDRTLIDVFDPYDPEGLRAGILAVIPEHAHDTRPQTGLHGYDELLLEIYENLVREECEADAMRERRLREGQRITGSHRRTLSLFCPPVAP